MNIMSKLRPRRTQINNVCRVNEKIKAKATYLYIDHCDVEKEKMELYVVYKLNVYTSMYFLDRWLLRNPIKQI